MAKIKQLFQKYKSVIAYLFFGGCTTVVNILVYDLCYYVLNIPNVASTVAAWVLAVVFAFVTNKLWVFDSRSFDAKTLRHEIPTFFGARALTGVLDVAIMYAAVDLLHQNPTLWKLISNVAVVILNYVASKLLIFRKK